MILFFSPQAVIPANQEQSLILISKDANLFALQLNSTIGVLTLANPVQRAHLWSQALVFAKIALQVVQAALTIQILKQFNAVDVQTI